MVSMLCHSNISSAIFYYSFRYLKSMVVHKGVIRNALAAQKTYVTQNRKSRLSSKNKITQPSEDQVVNGEILQELQLSDCYY